MKIKNLFCNGKACFKILLFMAILVFAVIHVSIVSYAKSSYNVDDSTIATELVEKLSSLRHVIGGTRRP